MAWEGLCSQTPLREALGTQSAEALGWEEREYEAFYKVLVEERSRAQKLRHREVREAAKAGDEAAIIARVERHGKDQQAFSQR